MKRIQFTAVLIIISLQAYSQLINGVVLDVETKKTIPSVNVFFNSTTLGTTTDKDGNFVLKMTQNEKLPIAVSAIGYYSVLISDYSSDSFLKVFLTPKIYPLGEVIVQSKKFNRERKIRDTRLTIFKKEFLGESLNARRCEIVNEDDLIFQYNENEDLLKAYSRNPLIINNEALGYKIIYYLETFEYSSSSGLLHLYGNHIFTEDASLDSTKRIIAEKRRRSAYLGSRMQFFRSLWDNNLDSSGFAIRNINNILLSPDSLIIQADSATRYLKKRGPVFISYFSKMSGTCINFLQDSVYFTKFGYFDPYGLSWLGEMGGQRIGDLLPFDYIYKKKELTRR